MLETVHGKVVSFPPARSHLQILTSYSNFSTRTASLLPVWEEVPSSLVCRDALAVSEERPRWGQPGWSCTEAHTAGQLARRTPALGLDLLTGYLAGDLRGSLRMVDIEVVLPSLVNLNIIKRKSKAVNDWYC